MSGNMPQTPQTTLTLRQRVAFAASQTHRAPTAPQRQAGNYPKGKFPWNGHEIAIETPKGGIRTGQDRAGRTWKVTMPAHYGYIRRTLSDADGDAVDVIVGPHPESDLVCVVDQVTAGGRFDEHKAVIGCLNVREAKELYLACYSSGWKGFRSITPMTRQQFSLWLKKGDTGRPIMTQVTKKYSRRAELAAAKYALSQGDGKSDERWITIHPHGHEEGTGTPVKIDGQGRIVGGPKGIADKGIKKLSDFGGKKEHADGGTGKHPEAKQEQPEASSDTKSPRFTVKGNEIYDSNGVRHGAARSPERAKEIADEWNANGKPGEGKRSGVANMSETSESEPHTVMFHGARSARDDMGAGAMLTPDQVWASGYATKTNMNTFRDEFMGAVHEVHVAPKNPKFITGSLHDAEAEVIRLASELGMEKRKTFRDAAALVGEKTGHDYLVAKDRDGKIIGAIALVGNVATAKNRHDPADVIRRAHASGDKRIPSNLLEAAGIKEGSTDTSQPSSPPSRADVAAAKVDSGKAGPVVSGGLAADIEKAKQQGVHPSVVKKWEQQLATEGDDSADAIEMKMFDGNRKFIRHGGKWKSTDGSYALDDDQIAKERSEGRVTDIGKLPLPPRTSTKDGKAVLTKFGSQEVADKFREMGGFSQVKAAKWGDDDWRVELWAVNPKSGNRNLTVIDFLPKTDKEYAIAKKKALGKANEKDQAAFGRMSAEREVDRHSRRATLAAARYSMARHTQPNPSRIRQIAVK